MRRSVVPYAAVVALLSAACTSASDREPLPEVFRTFPPDTTASPATSPTTSMPPVVSPTATLGATATTRGSEPPPRIPGKLVVLDVDGNVAVGSPTDIDFEPITDATAEGAAYFQPLWAPGGEWLAWSEASPAGFGLVTARPDGSQRVVAGMPSPPFYFYWSPDGRRIAALHNGVNGVEMRLVDAGGTVGRFAGSGTPFYLSWSPVSGDLIAHIGPDRLAAIDANGEITEVARTGAGYQAPQWLDAGIVHLADDALLLIDDAGHAARLVSLSGHASFVVNSQGTLMAIQTFAEDAPAITVGLQSAPTVLPNIVAVVDLRTGEISTASQDRSIGFFWSPDGSKLLMLHATDEPAHVDVSLWNGGRTRHVVRYVPQSSFVRDVLPFFNQYAQSYQPWAPDSVHFALAGTIDGEEGIWVLGADESQPTLVTRGTWVAWSDG